MNEIKRKERNKNLINLGNSELNRGVVARLDQLVSCGALSGDVQINTGSLFDGNEEKEKKTTINPSSL